MSLTKDNQGPAPVEFQNANVAPGSPLAVIGLFVELIRQRFNEDQGLQWIYNPDIKKTKIAIESSFVENTEHRNFRPAIFVDKEDSTIGRAVVGDRAGMNRKTTLDVFWGLMSVPMTIECVAAKRGESTVIADIVQFYLHASSDLIQSKFGLHEMTPVVLGKTVPMESDATAWVTPVTFTIQFPVRWTQEPVQVILRQIELNIQKSGAESATEYFEKLVFTDNS
jgi:hypothetical protein